MNWSAPSRRAGGHEMERECFLTILIALLGGVSILACSWWPVARNDGSPLRMEHTAWRGVWLPVMPALLIASVLCGWALVEPDPVAEKVPLKILFLSIPFLTLCFRALIRTGWSMLSGDTEGVTATVGLLRPSIIIAPRLAQRFDETQLEAALEHERAH